MRQDARVTGGAASAGRPEGRPEGRFGRRRVSGGGVALGLGAALLLVAAGCSPIKRAHGYAPSDTALETVVPGADTAATVAAKIGRPSTGGVVRNDVWFYVASRTEAVAWNAPEVVDRRVIVVRFDDDGVVSGIDRFGLEDGRVVNLVTRSTPTFGRELSVLQQIFGNLGNIEGAVQQGILGAD